MKPSATISEDAESYRRGVIFGLTMAEVLLLLIFCILLFLKIINDELKTTNRNLAQAEEELFVQKQLNKALSDENQSLAVQMALSAGGKVDNEFLETVLEEFVRLQATYPEKAEEFLSALEENPDLINELQLSTVDEWDELTTVAQYSVSKHEAAVLSKLDPDQRETFFMNADIASQFSAEEIRKIREVALQPATPTTQTPDGNNWPPIISLSEAKDYSFTVGSANLTEEFQAALSNEISEQILSILEEYDADVIEVIGHTDPQRMRSTRTTNLDDVSVSDLEDVNDIVLRANDNAGLGYARALSVTRELMKARVLQGYTILPYSAAQLISPADEINLSPDTYDPTQLRRIEIRVRRRQ
ncbi:MAG: hypothetical protein ACMUJK_11555 [Rhodobacterales bacterium]